MKIHNIIISNADEPTDKWWKTVEARADAPLIEATIAMTLSWSEYRKLLDENQRQRDIVVQRPC